MSVATFVTIGYGDAAGYERTPADVRDAAHAHDDRLREGGATTGVAGHPVQVRHDGAGVHVEDGRYLRSDLPVAGFAIIEADTVEQAVAMVSGVPCAVAGGVVEVWPLG